MRRRFLISLFASAGLVLVPAASVSAKQGYPYRWPGLYEGTGKLTGGFSSSNVQVDVTGGGTFRFCMRISKTGSIEKDHSHWALEPTTISAVVDSGEGSGTGMVDGFGTLGGYVKSKHELLAIAAGDEHLNITVDVLGLQFPEPAESVEVATHVPAHGTPSEFKGDVAVELHETQEQSGFRSTEHLRYKAHRVTSCAVSEPPTSG